MDSPLRLGVIGFGHFAKFSLPHLLAAGDVKLVAVSGQRPQKLPLALSNVAGLNTVNFMGVDQLLESDEVDIVYIATPPSTHYSYTKRALRCHKHVICEKPLSLIAKQARVLEKLARKRNLLLAVNQMQRYNPMVLFLKKLIDSPVLGKFVYGHLENHAGIAGLPPDHWFWNRKKSGGIFLEHGVHFFDLFNFLFGEGQLVNSERIIDSTYERQVRCTTIHNESIVDMYHGFTQKTNQEVQKWNFVWENGYVELSGWIPQRLVLDAQLQPPAAELMKEFLDRSFGDSTYRYNTTIIPNTIGSNSFGQIHLEVEDSREKGELYGWLLTTMFNDQLAWLRDKHHQRALTADDGVKAVEIAEKATKKAIAVKRS